MKLGIRSLFFFVVLGFPFAGNAHHYCPLEILAIPVGARPVGMGGAFSAVADDIYTLFYNPGGLAFLQKEAFTVSTSDIPGYGHENYLGYVFGVGNKSSVGFSYSYGADWEICTGGIGTTIRENIGLGLALKYKCQAQDCLLVDVGGVCRLLSERISIAFGCSNLTTIEGAPALAYTGIAVSLPDKTNQRVLITADIVVPPSEMNRLAHPVEELATQAGIECQVTDFLVLRGGLVNKGRPWYLVDKFKKPNEVGDYHSGFGVGFSVKPNERWVIDFARRYRSLDANKYIFSVTLSL